MGRIVVRRVISWRHVLSWQVALEFDLADAVVELLEQRQRTAVAVM